MKNISIFAIVLLALFAPAKAQTPDTVTGPNGRLPGYHYTWWYDTCWAFFDTTYPTHEGAFDLFTFIEPVWSWYVVPEIVDHPAAITGFGVWAGKPDSQYLTFNEPRKPEYVVVFQYANDTMVFVDSARWDTAARKIYKTPRNFDTARYGFYYIGLYEVHLKNPILVDSSFFLAVTANSNEMVPNTGMFRSEPTGHSLLLLQSHGRDCGKPDLCWSFILRETDSVWSIHIYPTDTYGIVQPMIDYAMVNTVPADSTKGSAYPNCKLSKHVNQTIYATPAPGYYFFRWDDGNTDNPRSVFITQDTTFTALFTDREAFRVTVQPDYTLRGHVTGGGTYFNGDTVTLTAIPNENYRFLCWNDGDTSNPRQFTITRDTSFTAHFNWISQHEGIFTTDDQTPLFSLTPNPAHNSVTVTINTSTPPPGSTLTLCDEAGRELFSTQISTLKSQFSILNYPAGTYFVTLRTPDASATRILIIK